ncbi:MAG: hypothetical protein ACFFAH_09635 [Promethearchaeota archaeon]
MTDTARAHVTLEKSYMDLVEELVDVFGATKAQVISNIVQHFFNDNKNDAFLDKLRTRKRKIKPPDKLKIDERIKRYLKRADNIPLDVFIDHLKLDIDFVIDNIEEWGIKFKFLLIDNKIVKEN